MNLNHTTKVNTISNTLNSRYDNLTLKTSLGGCLGSTKSDYLTNKQKPFCPI